MVAHVLELRFRLFSSLNPFASASQLSISLIIVLSHCWRIIITCLRECPKRGSEDGGADASTVSSKVVLVRATQPF